MSAEGTEMLATSRAELLNLAAARADSAPVQLTIRQPVRHWDARRRGDWITEEIKQVLVEAKLATPLTSVKAGSVHPSNRSRSNPALLNPTNRCLPCQQQLG